MAEKNTKLGTGFFGLLFLMLIGFKLTGIISCSWFWVFTPVWILLAIALLVTTILFIGDKRKY